MRVNLFQMYKGCPVLDFNFFSIHFVRVLFLRWYRFLRWAWILVYSGQTEGAHQIQCLPGRPCWIGRCTVGAPWCGWCGRNWNSRWAGRRAAACLGGSKSRFQCNWKWDNQLRWGYVHACCAGVRSVTGHPSSVQSNIVLLGPMFMPDPSCLTAGTVAPYKRLRGGVRFVAEIPKTSSGKILHRVMREEMKKTRKSRLWSR